MHGAYFQKRYQLEIQKESQPVRPIHIIHIHLTDKALVQNHVTVNVGGGAKLSILESFICLDNSVLQTLSNSITKINLFDNSFLCYLRNQNENNLAFHLGKTEIRQSQNSQLEISSLSFGAQLSKHELTIELKGQGASSQVFGAAIGNKQQHHDQQTWIKHSVGYCTTKQLYKTLLDGASRAIFNGKVSIALNAQKAFSEQLNSNLLLSAGAEADSRPQLEILADDVKATHGTTVGQLDEDEIFYLMSRAISRERAIEILSFGFIAETVEQLSDMRLKKVALEQIANAFKNLESLQK